MSIETIASWHSVAQQLGPEIKAAAYRASHDLGIDSNYLEKRLLLHLPRFRAGVLNLSLVQDEAYRIGLKDAYRSTHREWGRHKQLSGHLPQILQFKLVSQAIASEIYKTFHYIASDRSGIAHLGLFGEDDAIPCALLTLSNLHDSPLRMRLPLELTEKTLLVSRMFAFDWSPHNSISYLLGQAARWIRKNLQGIQKLLTYVNPNVNFTGASYKAANWQHEWSEEARYLYLHGDYITYRSFLALSESERLLVQQSELELEPFEILGVNL